MSRRKRDPADLSPRDARDKYLKRRRTDATDSSVNGWHYRLKLFTDWCAGIGITRVGDLTRLDLDDYYEYRAEQVQTVTLEGEMHTLKGFIEFLEGLDAVDDELSEAIRIPDIDPEERSSNEKLDAEDAHALLDYYRNSEDDYGTRQHALLELAWTTGARQGGLRALDIRDVNLETPHVEFRNRRGTGTGLKNKLRGERPVEIPRETADAIEHYIEHNRYDVRDDHGRQPLFASSRGRPTPNTFRVWCYLATLPCKHGPCPHGRDPEGCEMTQYHHASKCPSSRSPHPIRTGAITHLLNIGWPPEDVAERVNSAVKTIEQHYDKAAPDERFRRLRDRMEDRRRQLINNLDPSDPDNEIDH